MIDSALPVAPLVVLAFALLVGGVVGSVVPILPGGILSLVGVFVYWFASGYSEPGLLILSGVVFVALTAVVVDWLSGAISAKAGGASLRTTVIATVVGLVGMVGAGPVGFLVGTAGTVFVLTFVEGDDVETSARAAGVTLVGMLTSNVLQFLLTAGVLVVMVGVAVL
jgi:uncharacterized protein YqgC (DUF456 family)